MANIVVTRFPRGFFWSMNNRESPSHYISTNFPGLKVSPDTTLHETSDGNFRVALAGICVFAHKPDSDLAPVEHEIVKAARCGDSELYELLDNLCGKYVLFLQTPDRIRVFHDAAATRSTFYRRDFTAISSHAAMIADQEKSPLPFRGAYAGNSTPYPDVKILTANNAIDFKLKATYRYWPREPIASESAKSVADKLAYLGITSIKNIPKNIDIQHSLTAGLDSRTSLALLMKSGRDFSTYTYQTRAVSDLTIPALLTRYTKKRHTIVPTPSAGLDLSRAIDEAAYFRSTAHSIEGLRRYFSDSKSLSIVSNIFEIGQGYYQKMKLPADFRDSVSMSKVFASRQYGKYKEIEAYSVEKYNREIAMHFDEFYSETDFGEASKLISPYDLFYWEHRMSSWHSTPMIERDFYADSFIPLNSRNAISAMLSVPLQERIACAAFTQIIKNVDERLLEIPINPVESSNIKTM